MSPLHLACIRSWLRCGHAVTLYSYEPVRNAPERVVIKDARSIISKEYSKFLIPFRWPDREIIQPIISLSDLLRMKGMELGLGCWLDTDVFLLRPVSYELDKLHLAWEQTGLLERKKVGVSIMYLPPNHSIVSDYLNVLKLPDLMPDWLGFRRRYIKTLSWRLRGLKFCAVDISITAYGNLALRKLVKRHSVQRALSPKSFYYHWIGNETHRFFTDPNGEEVLRNANCVGIHVHRKSLINAPVVPGSLYDTALRLE